MICRSEDLYARAWRISISVCALLLISGTIVIIPTAVCCWTWSSHQHCTRQCSINKTTRLQDYARVWHVSFHHITAYYLDIWQFKIFKVITRKLLFTFCGHDVNESMLITKYAWVWMKLEKIRDIPTFLRCSVSSSLPVVLQRTMTMMELMILTSCILLLQPVLWLSQTRGAISQDLPLQSTPGEKVRELFLLPFSFVTFKTGIIAAHYVLFVSVFTVFCSAWYNYQYTAVSDCL